MSDEEKKSEAVERTMVFFNGDFYEKKIVWKELSSSETFEDNLVANGFERHDVWNVGSRDYPVQEIIVHYSMRAPYWWHVHLGHGDHCHEFLIEGEINYLRFLASPMCSTIQIADDISALRAVTDRLFTVYHRHSPPASTDDHSFLSSCAECDPSGEYEREVERKRSVEYEGRLRLGKVWASKMAPTLTADAWDRILYHDTPSEWTLEQSIAIKRRLQDAITRSRTCQQLLHVSKWTDGQRSEMGELLNGDRLSNLGEVMKKMFPLPSPLEVVS